MATSVKNERGSHQGEGPGGRLKDEVKNLLGAVGERALGQAKDTVTGAAQRLGDYAEEGGGPGLKAAITGAKDLAEGKSPARSAAGAGMSGVKESLGNLFGGGKGKKGGRGGSLKVTNIIESIDIGAPVRLVYDQWTQFRDYPTFMKKVENIDQEADEKLHWKAQIFWSHREWDSTITQQIPDKRIVWRSKGQKGSVDGAVTFHELAPELTRVVVVLEYHPQGFFEQTANLWRAQGRRARLELKHFRRHVMTHALLQPEEIEGWRGEIQDGEVVRDHETALREEQEGEEQEEHDEGQEQRDEYEEEPEGEDEGDEEEPDERGEPEDESGRYEEPDEDDEQDEDEEQDERPARRARPRQRRPATAQSRRRAPAESRRTRA